MLHSSGNNLQIALCPAYVTCNICFMYLKCTKDKKLCFALIYLACIFGVMVYSILALLVSLLGLFFEEKPLVFP